MATSLNDLKTRLRKFLANPSADSEFAKWLGLALLEVSEGTDPDAAHFAYSVHAAFSYGADGQYTRDELQATLIELAWPKPSFVTLENFPVKSDSGTDAQHSIPFSTSGGYSPEFGADRSHVHAELVTT